jgi:hypothetical protein
MEVCPTGIKQSEKVAPFYFCVDVGQYTGMNAASYEDFLTSIKQVDAKSLRFHMEREDFQKWVTDVLKDKNLAEEIGKIKNQKLRGQALRNSLYRAVLNRYNELTSKTH